MRATDAPYRWHAMLALASPVLAGIAWMAAQGAPPRYLVINAAALATGLALIALASRSLIPLLRYRHLAMCVLLALFALPILTGPEVSAVTRWLPLPFNFTLHAGMLLVPLLAVLASGNKAGASTALPAALFVALLQPDGASAAAIACVAIALFFVCRGWQMGLIALIGLLACALATIEDDLPPQQFVERVISDAWLIHPMLALSLLGAQIIGLLLLAFALPAPRPARLALAGSLLGFIALSLSNHFPAPLLGFGAAPILGYGLALALLAGARE